MLQFVKLLITEGHTSRVLAQCDNNMQLRAKPTSTLARRVVVEVGTTAVSNFTRTTNYFARTLFFLAVLM